ncbi:TonB-dependent receptor [Polymorphobacter sp.]|uniref:TonB-dependent receptor n=1 Tax=Polymorphobacter sp. TaxID=1909290 RepID=UPI003F6EB6C2
MSHLKTSTALALLLLPAAGLAQQAAAPGAEDGIAEIVVTAQRREESLQKVPLSVTAVTADVLRDRHFSDPAQLQFIAPNLQFTSFALAPGATNFSVRGIGTSSFSHLIEPSVATVIDGVVLGRPEMGVMQFSDLERVEILAGPQGMLFGKNASAGLINIVTTRPKLGVTEFVGHAEVGLVNAATDCCAMLFQATVNAPLGSTAAIRINSYYSDHNQLVRDTIPNPGSNYGHQEYGFKPKLLWEPNDQLSVYIAADYARGTGVGTGAVTPRTVAPGSPLIPFQAAAGIVPSPRNLLRSANGATNVTFDVGGITSEISYTLNSGLTISNILAWRKYKANHSFDADYHQIPQLDLVAARFDFEQVTEELRLSSNSGGAFEYQLGFFFYAGQTNRADFASANLNLGPPPAGLVNWAGFDAYDNLRSRSYAVYGQATYNLTEAFRLTAGGRYTWDRLTDVASNVIDDFAFGFAPAASYTQTNRANDFSWRVSAQYDFASAVMGYVTVSTGYKGPGFNQVYGGGLPIGPETSEAYEVGLKSRIGRSLLFNISAYWETVSDLQVQAFRPDIPAYLVSNAGSLRARGVEAELKWNAGQDLNLSSNVSFNDARFTSFARAQCYPGQTLAQGCVSDPQSPGNSFTDATGNRLQNAPKWAGNIAIDYEPMLGNALKGYVHADVYGRTAINFNANADPFTAQGGYAIANGSLGLGAEDESWRASLFCRNCFDRRFVTFIESNPGGIVGDYGQAFGLTSFRTLGVSLDVRF